MFFRRSCRRLKKWVMSSRDSFSQSDESLDALDGAKPSRVSKWRSSIRSGIKKSKKTKSIITKSIKQAQDRAIETVQQRLPISTFGPQGRTSNWSSDDALNSFERFVFQKLKIYG